MNVFQRCKTKQFRIMLVVLVLVALFGLVFGGAVSSMNRRIATGELYHAVYYELDNMRGRRPMPTIDEARQILRSNVAPEVFTLDNKWGAKYDVQLLTWSATSAVFSVTYAGPDSKLGTHDDGVVVLDLSEPRVGL